MTDEKRYELVDTQQLIEDLALFDWKREMIAEGQLTDEQLYDIHVEQDGTWTKRVKEQWTSQYNMMHQIYTEFVGKYIKE